MLALLSGTFSEPEDFVREGFGAAVHDHGIDAELVMAEMRASWFADGSVVDRIREAVIIPAHERGRSRIWLVGVSLGGLAALCYAARHAICEMLAANDRLISPTRFHNSVHNAPAGYWGIATGSQRSADSLAAFDASFGAGIVEALSRLAAYPDEAVLVIAYDAPYPEPLNATRPIPDAFAVALALASTQETTRGATITLETGGNESEVLDDPQLEKLRRAIPAARSLPLLRLLARERKGQATIDYLEGLSLTLHRS